MASVPFDTLELARKLEEAGFEPRQAQGPAAALASAMSRDIATTRDIAELRVELDRFRVELDRLRVGLGNKIELLKRDLTIRLGGIVAAIAAAAMTLDRLLG
jgi:hypothetical protein